MLLLIKSVTYIFLSDCLAQFCAFTCKKVWPNFFVITCDFYPICAFTCKKCDLIFLLSHLINWPNFVLSLVKNVTWFFGVTCDYLVWFIAFTSKTFVPIFCHIIVWPLSVLELLVKKCDDISLSQLIHVHSLTRFFVITSYKKFDLIFFVTNNLILLILFYMLFFFKTNSSNK